MIIKLLHYADTARSIRYCEPQGWLPVAPKLAEGEELIDFTIWQGDDEVKSIATNCGGDEGELLDISLDKLFWYSTRYFPDAPIFEEVKLP
jgi:hypothetical protein